METEEVKRKRFIIAVIIYSVMLALLVGFFTVHYTIARYSTSTENTYNAGLKDMNVDFTLTYVKNGETQRLNKTDLAASNGVLRLTPEQYSTMQLIINYTGDARCYYRFKIAESWLYADNIAVGDSTIIPHTLSDYSLSSVFYDNRSYDGWIYYKNAVDGESSNDVKNVIAISSVSVGSDAADLLNEDHSNCVEISLELEAVQWNRAKEIWGLDRLPWQSD